MNKYFANWLPIEPVKIGDIGYLEGKMFIHQLNISDLGYSLSGIEVKNNIVDQNLSYKSKFQIENNISAKAQLAGVKTQFKLSFEDKNAVYIKTSGCILRRYSNKKELGDFVKKCFKEGKWEKDWVIVTDVVESANTTIIVSEDSGTNITFSVDATTTNITDELMADASLKVVASQNIGYSLVQKNNITPFFILSRLKFSFRNMGNTFGVKFKKSANTSAPRYSSKKRITLRATERRNSEKRKDKILAKTIIFDEIE